MFDIIKNVNLHLHYCGSRCCFKRLARGQMFMGSEKIGRFYYSIFDIYLQLKGVLETLSSLSECDNKDQ